MAAKQLSRVEAMPEDETGRKPPRLPLPFPSNVIKLQSTDRREKPLARRGRAADEQALPGTSPMARMRFSRSCAPLCRARVNRARRRQMAFRTPRPRLLLEKQAVEQRVRRGRR
jgi:hypothetical protein